MFTMKKINCLLFSGLLVVGLTCNAAMSLSTPDYPYYNCPSMEKFTPTALTMEYCQRSANQKPSDYTNCLRKYKQPYNKAKMEYRNRQCRVSDVRYTELRYGMGYCKIEYTTKPSAKILSVENTSNDSRCVNRLKSALTKAYPKISE